MLACDPEEIANVLQVQPHEVRLKGKIRALGGGREMRELFNYWTLKSRVDSNDVNDHVRELLDMVPAVTFMEVIEGHQDA
jgi:hypothetical protein